MGKIFIIGLPRTGTTSVCAALLELGFKVAHCVYEDHIVEQADVVADTPAFCEYRKLDETYPESKFIYLDRSMDKWLPSIKLLLSKMFYNLTRKDGAGFNPLVKYCYQEIFQPLNRKSIADEKHLQRCYEKHRVGIRGYFKDRDDCLKEINLSEPEAYEEMTSFLGVTGVQDGFPKLNSNEQFTAWTKIKHVNKIHTRV